MDDISKILNDLYSGTLDESAWDRAMLGIADSVRASAALLYGTNPCTLAILRDEYHRFDPAVMDGYRRYWVQEDCRLPHFSRMPVAHPTTEQIAAIPNWRRTAFFNEFLRPADAPYFMPVWLHKSATKAVALSFQGTSKRGPFGPDDFETVQRLVPHVSRALEIRDRLQQARMSVATVRTALETVHFGVLILDREGKILESNRIAQSIIGAKGQGVQRKSDSTLYLREPAGTQLACWISTGVPKFTDGFLQVPREGRLPLSLLLVPVGGNMASWIVPDTRWLVLIFDPELRHALDAQCIAADLHLSAREAELASWLAMGENPGAIARRFGVKPNTVRVQLKSIFKKTGVRSQAELVRRIALGPAIHVKKPITHP